MNCLFWAKPGLSQRAKIRAEICMAPAVRKVRASDWVCAPLAQVSSMIRTCDRALIGATLNSEGSVVLLPVAVPAVTCSSVPLMNGAVKGHGNLTTGGHET
ncbi:hypothetical protein ABIB25_004379 [Nakamurella sp. UYEF19]